MNTSAERPLVVVGIDGSAGSQAALDWAQRYAALTEADLELVTAWHWPNSYGIAMAVDGWDPAEDAQRVVEKAAAGLHFSGDVTTTTEEGPTADVLVTHSKGAALLVVGCRGHGGFTGMLLGSVSAHCVHHAHCPVVVVR